jgi:hypothetical protein
MAGLVGCGKKEATEESGGGGDSAKPRDTSYGYPDWLDARTQKAVRGKVTVQILGAEVISREDMLIGVGLKNADENRKLEYVSWGEVGTSQMADEKGNSYRQRRLSFELEHETKKQFADKFGEKMGFGGGPVYSDRPRGDALAFERPVDTAKYISLELSGENIGEKDPIRFRIPRSAWTGEKD